MSSLAGSFLVARPVLQDPSFAQTVVLLLQHTEEGAFGLVVNRRAKQKNLPFRVFVGGPCPSDGLFMLHAYEDWLDSEEEESEREVAPGVYLGDSSTADRLMEGEEADRVRYRMFSGYAGWGPDQLEREWSAGAWAVVPATAELLFDTPFEDLWSNLLPPTLPEPSLN